MGILRGNDKVIDFTLLQKRGLLKKEPLSREQQTPDIVDLIASGSSSMDSTLPSSSPSVSSNPFSFLDAVASASTSSSSSSISSSMSSEGLVKDMQALKLKMDDLEYKLERLLEKMSSMDNLK